MNSKHFLGAADRTSQPEKKSGRSFSFDDQPFPLKRYFLLYGGFLALIFYALLLFFTFDLIRQSLWKQHIQVAQQRTSYIFYDVLQDFLVPRNLTLGTVSPGDEKLRQELREKINEIMSSFPNLAKLKLFNKDSMVLYDHLNPELEGKLYEDRDDEPFQKALHGQIGFESTIASDGEHLMEIYVPVVASGSPKLEGIIEIYERTSGFEAFLTQSLIKVLGFPSGIFVCFVLVLFFLVRKADGLIANQNSLLRKIHQTMAKYLPDAAVNAISKSGGSEENLAGGKRLFLTVLFTDVRGFTAYSERSEPEAIVSKLNQLFDLQAEIMYRHGGSIDKFVGDEIVALFETAESAVAAATEIMEEMSRHPEGDLKIGAGVHSGDLVLGTIGTQERRDFSVIGDTVNTGARLCSKAEPGEILISPMVFEKLPLTIQKCFSSTRSLELKGKSEPVQVYSLTTPGK